MSHQTLHQAILYCDLTYLIKYICESCIELKIISITERVLCSRFFIIFIALPHLSNSKLYVMFSLSRIMKIWGSHWKGEWLVYFHTASKNRAEMEVLMHGTTVLSKHRSGKLLMFHRVISVMTKTWKSSRHLFVCLFMGLPCSTHWPLTPVASPCNYRCDPGCWGEGGRGFDLKWQANQHPLLSVLTKPCPKGSAENGTLLKLISGLNLRKRCPQQMNNDLSDHTTLLKQSTC